MQKKRYSLRTYAIETSLNEATDHACGTCVRNSSRFLKVVLRSNHDNIQALATGASVWIARTQALPWSL